MDPIQVVEALPQTIADLETEVRNAKLFAIGSSLLLLYIAIQVSRRGR